MLIFIFFAFNTSVHAEDSSVSRATLAGLQSVYVLVENIQPNIQSYAKKHGLTAASLKEAIEERLHQADIKTVSGQAWMNLPGRPALYVNVNTHETERYWYAYNINIELRQMVLMEANPQVKTLAATWSINMTGIANIGNLHIIKNNLIVLIDRFVAAHRSVNR